MSSDLAFDVGNTGFSVPEIDRLIEAVEPEESSAPAVDVVQENGLTRAQLSDVWQFSAAPIAVW